TADVTGTLPIGSGGTGLATTPLDGELLIGKTSTNSYVKSTLTAGDGINVTNGSGSITLETKLTTSGGTGSSSSNSGLEVSSSGLTLLKGCAQDLSLSWDDANDLWKCSSAGIGTITAVGDVVGGQAFTSGGTGTSLWFHDSGF